MYVIAEYTFIWYEALNWRFSLIRYVCTYICCYEDVRARVGYESEKFAEEKMWIQITVKVKNICTQ